MIKIHKRIKFLVCSALLCSALYQAPAQPPPRINIPPQPELAREPVLPPITLAELTPLMGAPTRLTLHPRAESPQVVFEEIVKQSKQQGVEVRLHPSLQRRGLTGQPITVDIENQPFWSAMQILSPKLRLYPVSWGRGGAGIVFGPEDDAPGGDRMMQGISLVRGPFVIFANQLERTQTTTHVPGEKLPVLRRNTLILSLTAFADPKLRMLANSGRVTLDEVVDDKGNSLLPDDTDLSASFGGQRLSLRVGLNQPANMGTRIVTFRATLRMPVIARQELWEVPDILKAKNVSKTVGEQRYTLEEVTKTNQTYEVRIRGARLQAERRRMLFNPFNSVRLVDAQGNEYERRNVDTRGEGEEVAVRLNFGRGLIASRPLVDQVFNQPQPGEPAKLIWPIPVEMRSLEIPIEFTDLPIP